GASGTLRSRQRSSGPPCGRRRAASRPTCRREWSTSAWSSTRWRASRTGPTAIARPRTPPSLSPPETSPTAPPIPPCTSPPAAPRGLTLAVHAVEGGPAGAYVYRPTTHALELLAAGDFRNRSAYLCLEQPLGGDAAAVIYFLARLDELTDLFGDRGYRLANLEAGLAGGRAYLAAYAQGFGASGLTFYDADVVQFFSPHAAGKDAIFVTALGRSAADGRVTIDSNLTVRGRPS